MKSPEPLTTVTSNRFWARLSLQAKTLSIFLFVALIPVIGVAILGTIQTQRALTNAAESSLRSNAAQSAASLDTFITTALDGIRVESQSPDLVEYLRLSPAARQRSIFGKRTLTYLNILSRKDTTNIFSYGVIDKNGINILDSDGARFGSSEANTLYFKQAVETGIPFASPVVYRTDGASVIYFASPVRNANREIIGVLRVEYAAGILQQIALANAQAAGAKTTVLVLDEYNIRLVDTSNPELIQKPVAPLEKDVFDKVVAEGRLLARTSPNDPALRNVEFAAALDRTLDSQFFEIDSLTDTLGIDSVATGRMKELPWIVVVSQPRSLLLENVQRQTISNLLILLAVAIVVGGAALITSRTLISPLQSLTRTAESIASGNLGSRATIQTQDEIGILARSFNQMTDQLSQILSGLEERVKERTQALTRRSSQLEAIANVARSIASVQEVDRLLTEVTVLVSERFGFYHVGIFLLDDIKEYANLRAANSQGGQKMLARGHRLKVGEQGIVGYVTLRGQARIALDVGSEAVFFNNPDLPDTHSEVALPLQSGSEIIGALDIQSIETNAFSQEDLEIFSVLADQISVAIQGTRSLEQAKRALHEAEVASKQLTGQAWRDYSEKSSVRGYRYDGIKPEALKAPSLEGDTDSLSLPVQLRGQVIGRLKLKRADVNRKWTEDELAVLESTAERLAIALDSARLLDEAQRRAERETFLSEMGAKLGTSFQLDSILRDTVEELGQNLKGSTVSFQLVNPSAPPTADSINPNGASERRKKSE